MEGDFKEPPPPYQQELPSFASLPERPVTQFHRSVTDLEMWIEYNRI